MDKRCKHGQFVPDHCQNTACALLLAPHFSNTTEFIIEQIIATRLLVKVVWLGPNLSRVVNQIKSKYYNPNAIARDKPTKSVLILSWNPSDTVPDDGDFISTSFKSLPRIGDAYEEMRLVKFSWSELERSAYIAFESLWNIEFTKEEYTALLRLYNDNVEIGHDQAARVYNTACQWLRTNEQLLANWTSGKK